MCLNFNLLTFKFITFTLSFRILKVWEVYASWMSQLLHVYACEKYTILNDIALYLEQQGGEGNNEMKSNT